MKIKKGKFELNKELLKKILEELVVVMRPMSEEVRKIGMKYKDNLGEFNEATNACMIGFIKTLADKNAKDMCIMLAHRLMIEEAQTVGSNEELNKQIKDEKTPKYFG